MISKRLSKNLLILLIAYWSISPVLSQTKKEINNQFQFWTSLNVTMRITDRWGVIGDFHIKRNNFIKDPSFYFLRLGAVYWLDNKFSFAGGIAGLWLATELEVGTRFAFEQRLFEQALWRSRIRRVVFLQRIRIEQRWSELLNEDGSVNRILFSNRFRFLFSGTIKVFNNDDFPKLIISDEILFQFGDEIIYNTFDQNRFFVGINYRFNKNWTFDFGYMFVFQQKYSGYQYDANHTIRLFFYYTPDLRKVKDQNMPHYPINGGE